MGKKATKASRKYAASGQLKKEIDARRKHKQIKKKIEGSKAVRSKKQLGASIGQDGRKGKGKELDSGGGSDADPEDDVEEDEVGKFKGMSVDDFLGGGFIDDEAMEANEDEDEEGKQLDDGSFSDVDDLEEEGEAHALELAKLAEKDPEFYKYLQQNDQELLDFDPQGGEDLDMDEDEDEEADVEDEEHDVDKTPVLTKAILRKWQKALLEHRSLKALRRLLIAFRSAAHMNDSDDLAWTIDSPAVHDKLVTTALRYTPVILEHHVPYRILPDGSFKQPAQSAKLKVLQKLILSYFYNIISVLEQVSEHDIVLLAVTESVKLLPYVIGSRKAVKLYMKTCLQLWSSADDDIRIAAFLALRKLSSFTDQSIKGAVLKNTYLTLVRSAKSTSVHTLPSINLMKNSASELFCSDHAAAYQHAFMYIRQLAVHLRSSLKVKTKESYKQVYNWQYVHCIDFWSLVLAKACDAEAEIQRGGDESEMKALIYPLTQVSLGAIKLISNSRSYPFHLCLIRSLIHLARHTRIYIPIAPYLLPIVTSSLSPSSRPKPSTLRPLDFETYIRAPAQYVRTRVYAEGLLEESVYLLAEWLATRQVQGSIAFPEIIVPLTVTLKKSNKKAMGGKEAGLVKVLLERMEEGAKWIEQRRKLVTFGPKFTDEVRAWEQDINIEDTPMGKYMKTQRKIRQRRQKLVDKAREGEDEIIED